ncbi:MAG: hypothetical protein LBH96_05980 [Candidatus Peribacteria bacterium]|jgi:hypothetical protein|nr:hypothetical protein [Candidatus Peribacteria bacterium]
MFEFKDAYGNTGRTEAKVSWIDKDTVTGSISYSTTGATNQNVTATIIFNKSGVDVTNNSGNSYTFTGNGSFMFEYKDSYGNTGRTEAKVSWIDRVAPVCSITYNPDTSANRDIATLVGCSEPIIITNNGGNASYPFSSNGNFTFKFVDNAGNTGTAIALVSWITARQGGG